MTWRLLDFGRIRAQIKAAGARQEQALAAYEKTLLTSFEEVENALVAGARERVRSSTPESPEHTPLPSKPSWP